MDRRSSDKSNERGGRGAGYSSDIVSQKSLQRRQYRGRSEETQLNVSSATSGNVAERPSISLDSKNYSKGSSKFSTGSSIPDFRLGLGTRGVFRQVVSKEKHGPGPSNTTTSSEMLEDSESSAYDSDKMFEFLKEHEKESEKFHLKKTSEALHLGAAMLPEINRTQIVASSLVKRTAFSENTFSADVRLSSSSSQKSSLISEMKLPTVRKSLEPVRPVKKSSLEPVRSVRKSSVDTTRSVSFQPSEDINYKFRDPKISRSEIEEREIGTISSTGKFRQPPSMTYFLNKFTKKLEASQFKVTQTEEIKKVQVTEKYLDIEVVPEEDLEIKKYYRNFIIYILFLSCLTIFALSMVSSHMYYFTSITKKLFFDTPTFNFTNNDSYRLTKRDILGRKTLRHSNNFGDFWVFAESVLIDMLYWEFYRELLDPLDHSLEDDRKMLYENQIIGIPRMRQIRVRNDSCEIHPEMSRFFQDCYSYYNIFSEETRPIREGMEGSTTATAWVYTEASKLHTTFYFGEISIYGGGGYYIDLGKTKDETKAIIAELKENYWLGRPTRAVFIDFTIYNANVNFFCLCKLVMEFPPMGGMIPIADFQTLKLIRYLRPFDFFVLGIEFIFVIFVVYYTVRMIKTVSVEGRIFFLFFWNYIDIIILVLSYLYIVLGILLYFKVAFLLSQLPLRKDKYTEFQSAKMLQIFFNTTIAFLIFIAWTKMYKFLNYNTIMLELKATLSRSFKDILGFFPMFLTMFFTFAMLGFLFFGNVVKDYRTVGASMMALLQTFVGEFQYEQIQEANKVIGPFFYIAFLFFIIFISLNVFIAIINDAYAGVKSKFHFHQPKTGKYFKRAALNVLGCFCCGLDKKLERRPKIERKAAYEMIRHNLKRLGFTDIEIKVFFSKYDINVNNALSEKIRKKIIEDLELKKINFSETAEQFRIRVLKRKVDSMVDRIEEIEASLKPVIDKVDIILHRKENKK